MSKAYDAEEFKARANIKTRNVWFLLNLLLTAQYCSNVTKGTYDSKYIVPFLLLCWVPYVFMPNIAKRYIDASINIMQLNTPHRIINFLSLKRINILATGNIYAKESIVWLVHTIKP